MTDKSSEERVDALLAAPDVTAKNEGERTKYYQRKAQDKARRERERRGKSKRRPTIEDMLADLVRVAEDKQTNPWAKFRSISRRRYELYGHYPIKFLDEEFGQFNHALEVAGLRDQPGTRLWRANRAKESRRKHAARYLERYVQPYVVDREKLRLERGSYRMLSISDTHAMMMCPFTYLAFLSTIQELRPEGVLLNGDTMDTVQLSRHPKVPGWTPPLQMELDFHRMMCAGIRSVHDGDLFMTGGNHDLPVRLASYLTQTAPELASLDNLRVDKLLGLDELDIQLFHGGSIVSPKGEEDAHHGFLLFDFYRIHHGTKLGQKPALDELLAAGRSGQSGHVHRSALAFGTTETTEGLSWMCTPMGSRHEVARFYNKSSNTGWQRGFGYAELFSDQTVHQYPCVVRPTSGGGERITCEGYTFTRPKSLRDPDPNTNWLEDGQYDLKK
jgi:hypothetical protein